MSSEQDQTDLVEELSLLTRSWNQSLSDEEMKTFAFIVAQDSDNLRKFKEIHNPRLEEVSARNYLKPGSFTPFSIYLSALEDARYPALPLDIDLPPYEWYRALASSVGGGVDTVSRDFVRSLRWFDHYLSRSSAVVLFLLRLKHGESLVNRMCFKLSELKCDVRSIDFVQIAQDWNDKNLDQEFTIWTPEIYRYRTLIDEDGVKNFQIAI